MVEHNHTPRKAKIRSLLTSLGFQLYEKGERADDVYINANGHNELNLTIPTV
jgi:hypothetical protein